MDLGLEDQIVLALRGISQAIDLWSRELWQQHGLTAPQLGVLRTVIAGVHVSPVALANALHLSQPTVTGILGRLESRGLIARSRSASDRRMTIAVPTDEGRRLAAAAPPLLRDRFRAELSKLPAWQQTDILSVLQRVAAMMHAPQVTEGPFFYHDANGAGAKTTKRKRKRTPQTIPPESDSPDT